MNFNDSFLDDEDKKFAYKEMALQPKLGSSDLNEYMDQSVDYGDAQFSDVRSLKLKKNIRALF